MSDIKLDNTHDIDVTNSEVTLVYDDVAITQEIRIGMRFFRGEWFLDERVGIPYFQRIFTGVKTNDMAIVQATYRRALYSIPGVLNVDYVNASYDEDATLRRVNVEWRCQVSGAPETFIEGVEALVIP